MSGKIELILYSALWGLIVVLFLVLLFFVGQNRGILITRTNSKTESVYDLSGVDLTEFVSVEDGWEYYPNQRLARNPGVEPVMSGYVNLNTAVTDTGTVVNPDIASYRMHLTGVTEETAFFLPIDAGQYEVFLNGKKIETRFDKRLITQTITTLQPGIDYEIIIESNSFIPAMGYAPQVISKNTMAEKLDYTRIIMLITLSIAIFSLALVLAVCFSSPRKEQKYVIGIFLQTLFFSLWYVIYPNKYFATLHKLFPQMPDTTVVFCLAFCLTGSLVMHGFLIRPHLQEVWNSRLIRWYPYGLIVILGASLTMLEGDLWAISNVVVLGIDLLLLFATLFLLMRKLVRREFEDYLQLCAQTMIPFAIGIAMMFSSILMDLNYMLIISWILMVFYLLMLISMLKHNYEMRKRLEEANAAQDKMLHLQGAFWASQIQPHFIYNTLQAIQALCIVDPEKAVELTGKFSKHLRNSVDYINTTELIPFKAELENVNNYVEIQKVRFGQKLIYEEKIETWDFQLPPLTVQPLVENAIRYGVRGKNQTGTVRLEVVRRSDGIYITVTDSGEGFDPDHIKENGGIANVRSRLTAYLRATLSYTQTEEGTAAQIFIPSREVRTVENNSG